MNFEQEFWLVIIGGILTIVGIVIGQNYADKNIRRGVSLNRKQEHIKELEAQLKHLTLLPIRAFFKETSAQSTWIDFSPMSFYNKPSNLDNYSKFVIKGTKEIIDVLINIRTSPSYPILKNLKYNLRFRPLSFAPEVFRQMSKNNEVGVFFVHTEQIKQDSDLHFFTLVDESYTVDMFKQDFVNYITELNELYELEKSNLD